MDFIRRFINRNNLKTSYDALLTFLNFLKIKFILFMLRFLNVGQLHYDRDKKRYTLNYYYGTEMFTIILPYERRINNMLSVNHNGEDITSLIKKHLGPSHNFHKIPSTPKLLGYSKINIRYRNGNIKEYNDNDIIEF